MYSALIAALIAINLQS